MWSGRADDGCCRRMLRAVEAGESDPQVLADLAKGRLRDKLPALRRALAGRVQPQHRQLLGELLDHITYLEQAIHRIEVSLATLLATLLAEQEEAVQLLLTLPATGPVTAAAIIAEIGTDMMVSREYPPSGDGMADVVPAGAPTGSARPGLGSGQ